ncbi:MAG TPA: glycosyltransferase [Gaiellaceae bacterium]|nr:glycosyltransferase [Gaiellaceae bacterium]
MTSALSEGVLPGLSPRVERRLPTDASALVAVLRSRSRTRLRRSATYEDRIYRSSMTFLGIFIALFILAVKSSALHGGTTGHLFLVYSVLVTSFELSRLVAASFHVRTSNACYELAETEPYEPTVTFVIPCMNEEEAIAISVVNSLAAEYPEDKVEVIVVDDGSTDATPAVLADLRRRNPRLQVITFPHNLGKRHAMAEGFRHARGEIIVQLDSDSYIEPAGLRALVTPFANEQIGAVCAHADPANADVNFLTRMQAAYYFLSFRILKAAESTFLAVFCCSGCSSAYRKQVVMPALDNWLGETFLGKPVTWGDDRALTNWVLRSGFRTIYTHRAKAYTICPDNLRQLLKQQARWKKGWLVNSIFATPFVVRRYPFVAATYFLPLIVLTLLTPFMAVRGLVWLPLVEHRLPVFYLVGVFGIALMVAIYYRRVERANRYWPYVFLWSALNVFVLSFVLFYAIATLQNRAWGTR